MAYDERLMAVQNVIIIAVCLKKKHESIKKKKRIRRRMRAGQFIRYYN